MIFDQKWKEKPRKGYEFIYRYYDDQGKSYIGHTKQSLCLRAGGKRGAGYTQASSKFQEAISINGFESFNYEILEEVPCTDVDEKEKYYVSKFDSKHNGYNSTDGGNIYYENMKKRCYTIDLREYNNEQLDNLLNNAVIFIGLDQNTTITNIEDLFNGMENTFLSYCYSYYAFEGEYLHIRCNPILIVFNFIDLMILKKYETQFEIESVMSCSERLGADILTSKEYDVVKVILPNNKVKSFDMC